MKSVTFLARDLNGRKAWGVRELEETAVQRLNYVIY